MTLTQFLSVNIFQYMLVTIRLSTALMLMPGIGSTMVMARARLWLGLAISLAALPMVASTLPPEPRQPAELLAIIAGEIVIGGFMGAVAQMLMASVDVAGTFIGFQTGMTNAFSFDAISQQQSQVLTSFLSALSLALVFGVDLHHLFLRALVDSYDLFPPGRMLPFDDMSTTLTHMMTHAFEIGMRMAAPVLVFGLVFHVGMGLMGRLVPQMQVYFVALPIQLLMGLWMMMVALPLLLTLLTTDFAQGLGPFLK